jgi:hypothetical protein
MAAIWFVAIDISVAQRAAASANSLPRLPEFGLRPMRDHRKGNPRMGTLLVSGRWISCIDQARKQPPITRGPRYGTAAARVYSPVAKVLNIAFPAPHTCVRPIPLIHPNINGPVLYAPTNEVCTYIPARLQPARYSARITALYWPCFQ